jgi:hypothetical protein
MSYSQGASSGNLVLIQNQSAAGLTGVQFKTNVTGYDVYFLQFYNIVASANLNDYMILNFSTNGGSSYDTTAIYSFGGLLCIPGTGLSDQSVSGSTSYRMAGLGDNSTAVATLNGQCYLYSLGTSSYSSMFSTCSGHSSGFGYDSGFFGGTYANAAVVNAFNISLLSGGAFTSGTLKLYGIQN